MTGDGRSKQQEDICHREGLDVPENESEDDKNLRRGDRLEENVSEGENGLGEFCLCQKASGTCV